MPKNKGNTTADQPTPIKKANKATIDEMLSIEGFRKRVAENQPNKYQPHNSKAANKRLYARIAAAERCIADK